MSRVVYVNGAYRRYDEAYVHVEDRGFQFADSVYEVMEVRGSQLVDATRHLDRLQRSLAELAIRPPVSRAVLLQITARVIDRNLVRNGVVYVQVSRGESPRDFAYPPATVAPTLVVIARSQSPARLSQQATAGIAVKTMPDIRWGRSDIKTVMLLPACLAKDAARRDGAKEAWFVDAAGFVTEGASSNAWIVTAGGVLVTRHADSAILAGVTRATALDAAAGHGLKVEQRAFTVAEALAAREAFITSATNIVMPVVEIDGQKIGGGRPGPVSQQLRLRFHDFAETSDSDKGHLPNS